MTLSYFFSNEHMIWSLMHIYFYGDTFISASFMLICNFRMSLRMWYMIYIYIPDMIIIACIFPVQRDL